MSTTVDRFAGEYFTLNSISEGRRAQVLAALARFERSLSVPLEQATDSELRAWLVVLFAEGLKASSVATYLKAVLPFYQWCWRSRLIDAEQLMRLRDVSPPRGFNTAQPRPYSRKELTRFWTELDARFPYTTPARMDRFERGKMGLRLLKRHAMRLQLDAIIELALVCGLRRQEIYHLAIDDVHWDNKYIVVHGKRVDQNEKVREVPYPASTRRAVREWWHMRGLLGPTHGLLWCSVTGPDPASRLNETRMAEILHSFGNWQLHRLRHTCATERLRAGMKLEELQRFLGHANVQQTLRYAKLVRSDIHRASVRTDADFQSRIKPAA